MATHKDLEAWRQAIQLAKGVYSMTAAFPSSEIYGLVSQMRRSAVSIASNIAEGAARNTDKEFIHLLYVALGSIAELETQYIRAKELSFMEGSPIMDNDLENLRKLTVGLIKYLSPITVHCSLFTGSHRSSISLSLSRVNGLLK